MLCASNMFGVVVSAILLSTVTGLYVPHPEFQRAVVHKKIAATWDEAKLQCEREGATLASPLNTGLLEYMKSSIGVNNHNTPYFIGMRVIYNPEPVIVSVEGTPLNDLPQAVLDMIEQIDPKDGDCLRMDSHDIRTGPCKDQLPYICYKNTTTEDCAVGYTQLSTGNYYKLHKSDVEWEVANSTCVSEGSYLVVINDEQEAEAVKKFAFPGLFKIWIMIGNREVNGEWRSVNGEPLDEIFHTWASSRSFYENACGALKNNGLLDDMECNVYSTFPFVCEKSCPTD